MERNNFFCENFERNIQDIWTDIISGIIIGEIYRLWKSRWIFSLPKNVRARKLAESNDLITFRWNIFVSMYHKEKIFDPLPIYITMKRTSRLNIRWPENQIREKDTLRRKRPHLFFPPFLSCFANILPGEEEERRQFSSAWQWECAFRRWR